MLLYLSRLAVAALALAAAGPSAVNTSLTEDGRIGKITDAQGIGAVRPATAERWTPLAEGMLLMPGDWLRTDLRGANALTVRLAAQARLTIGPGSLVELIAPQRVRIYTGDAKIVAAEKSPVEVVGPDRKAVAVKGTQLFQIDKEKLVRLETDPLWLKGFESRVVGESIGSLVANIDGRNTPLTVGYHKVTVDIRDQIARTVVEESFVNHTDVRLEGVFHFPLPQDASISGFGMWIGSELVEADVVEKLRAREIYETILRERRDPGLLEWSGGNIFKARVFPIEAHAEKRIKISYTQVLPLHGAAYRYSYALQSELLRQHPLRELAIDVKLNSAAPLRRVASPTHPVRVQQAAHSARVEFAAQEYAPARDFEVTVELADRQSGLSPVPYRRGDDGYLMLLLTPPEFQRGPSRDVLPDGEPLDLLILADTSASLDRSARARQAQFVAALLASLTPKDRVNLAGCDVDCDWVFKQPVSATPKNLDAVRGFLDQRASLGWTDLDKAFSSAFAQAGAKTRIVYVGDGIVTSGDADPVAFARRLRRLYAGKQGTCYAVSVGSSYEAAALRAIASCGGGSVRQMSGDRGLQATARELLSEMARPPLSDLKLEFHGLQVARVYPEELPNLPAGDQQIILGRYLPTGKDQSGEVIVTGTFDGRPIRYASRVSLRDAERGNSFIPRLWARMHLDYLLQQGASQTIQDEIIALSEEYNIMTPYTSLLVLETDADRERFKVQRRFMMRDGEKFFAQGRDNVNYDLVQQQMRRAGLWRQGLRRNVLSQLAGLGRDPSLFPPANTWPSMSGPMSMAAGKQYQRIAGPGPMSAPVGRSSVAGARLMLREELAQSQFSSQDLGETRKDGESLGRNAKSESSAEEMADYDSSLAMGRPTESLTMMATPRTIIQDEEEEQLPLGDEKLKLARETPLDAVVACKRVFETPIAFNKPVDIAERRFAIRGFNFSGWTTNANPFRAGLQANRYWNPAPYYGNWLDGLFPYLPAAPAKVESKEPKKPWPAEAKTIARSLLRDELLAKLPDGMRIRRQSESFDARFAELTSLSSMTALVSPTAWLTRSEGSGQTTLTWCDRQERGAIAMALELGRLRPSLPADLELRAIGVALDGFLLAPLDRSYAEANVELKPQGEDRVLMRITYPTSPHFEMLVLIDTARHVVLSTEYHQDGKLTSTTKHDDFVRVAGAWWPGRIESFDPRGRRTSLVTQKFTVLGPDALTAEMRRQLAGRDRVQFLHAPLPKLLDAKRALAAGKATFDQQIVLAEQFLRTQQWARALEHLAAAEKLAAGKPGMRWLRDALLSMSRRREELKARTIEEAGRLAAPSAGGATLPPASDLLFLADRLISQSAGALQANEMLRLLDVLRPVYQRQPAFTGAMKRWRQQQVSYLQQTAQAQEAIKLLERLTADYPHDYNLRQEYAQRLANRGDHETAFRLLREALSGKIEWLSYEEESLRNTYNQLMQAQGRWTELDQFFAEWLKRNPETSTPYEQYLGVLVRLDKLDKANALAARWLAEGHAPGKPSPAAAARVQAAVAFMLGNSYGMYTNRFDERWLQPLAHAAIVLVRQESLDHLADRIMTDGHFRSSDECRQVRKAALAMLLGQLDQLKPPAIGRLVSWVLVDDPAVDASQWRQIARRLRKRWDEEKQPEAKARLSSLLVQILSARSTPDELLDFLRTQWRGGAPDDRAGYARLLFDALLAQPWSQAHEDEALALLEKLAEGQKEPPPRLAVQLGSLYRLTDRMVAARYQARMKAVEHPEKLPRGELQRQATANRKAACEGFADRLRREAAKRTGPIVAWLNAERLYLDVRAGRNLDQAAAECWKALGPAPKQSAGEDDPQARLDEALQIRFLTTLANLAVRKSAPPGTAERLLKYVDAGIAAAERDDLRWQSIKYQLLVALDRPKDLEQALRAWAAADGPVNRWRLALGYLLAEQGKLAPAITLFEAVAAADELGPAEHRALADWYMAVGRRENYQKSMIAVYETIEEWQLSNLLSQQLGPWQRRDAHLPAELDKEVLIVFATLFEKSSSPGGYLWQLDQFYRETRDFRLLACLADGVVGHTAGQVYPFLQGMSGVLGEIRDEATADSLVEQVGKTRRRATTDVDRRALDLLEVLVERRAAEVMNQPGPHREKALAALRRAFRRQWAAGEPRLMADFLAGLGHITQPRLAAEQVSELETLHQGAAKGTIDGLQIAMRLAQAQWNYGKTDVARDLLQLALDDYQRANSGVLPVDANEALGTLVSYFEQRRHYAEGERVLFAQLRHPLNGQQAEWLTRQLYQLYESAIRNDGEVSLGRGPALYRAAAAKIETAMAAGSPDHHGQLVQCLSSTYYAAHQKHFSGVADDLRRFAFQRCSTLIRRDLNNYSSMIIQVAQTLHDIAGPRDGLAFLVEQMEREPRWLRYNNQGSWNQYGWMLGEWRLETAKSGGLGDVEPRLLKLVLAELRAELETREPRNNEIYHRNNPRYWAEKEDDFRRTAEAVYAQRKSSGAAVAYIAEYLYHGLRCHDRAIEMLSLAYRQNLLNESAETQLIQYLHERKRHGESIAILLPLVERRPDNVQYRVWLMRAYFCTHQPDQLRAALKQANGHFRKDGRWTESNMAALAASCLDNELFAESIQYYHEVIPLHQRTQPNRGIGDGTLSAYYRKLAEACVGRKDTAAAIEAACGAIVSWGPQAAGRAQALDTLREVLRRSPDLDAFVAELDKRSAATGLHNPLVRKALGQAYLGKGKCDKALVQLKLAVELQANDTETHQSLVACYDQMSDPEGGVRQLLRSVEASPRDPKLYQDLGRRYAALNRPREAERAVTSIVEMLPHESESHAALAEIRQQQDRWDEAIHEWQQVARLRALEPTGLLRLAEAQIHQRLWDDADATVRRLQSRSWPSRFNNLDYPTWQLRQKIEQGRRAR